VLLAIWLIEYDREFQRAAATRLPVPVIFLHAVLAVGGLGSGTSLGARGVAARRRSWAGRRP